MTVPLKISEARERVLAAVSPLPSEPVALANALDRVLAAELAATTDVPHFDNSAMDGFAVAPGPSRRLLRIAGESRAGLPATAPLGPGEAIRISTGAALPLGAGAVVRVEDVVENDGRIVLEVPVAPGENVRRAGEDLRAGTVVLRRGTTLGPAELAVAVGAGVAKVDVARRPRVAVLCTGDELREPGVPLGPGEIHNSNQIVLAALARKAGAEVVEARAVPDDRDSTERAFADALQRADVVIASGGVSVGPHDHVKPALAELGVEESFWRVLLQPGGPTWFGTRGSQLVFGLPGNPVSSHVTFVLFARPALLALQGVKQPLPPRGDATLSEPIVRRDRRERAIPVRLEGTDTGFRAVPLGLQGSHITSSLSGAAALAFVPPGEGAIDAGGHVEVEPL